MTNTNRQQFRDVVYSETNGTCIVPWCDAEADDSHHIIERELWNDGGYIAPNGAAVCNQHHQYAEANYIPPQAFWFWKRISEPELPTSVPSPHINKWGDELESPPWKEHRDYIKYQSTRHLLPLYWHDHTLAKERIENDDTGADSLSHLVDVPLVVMRKIDGSNCTLVSDVETPVRARNGSSAHETMKPLYRPGGLYWQQEVNEKLPERLQVVGEWVYAKHSIHYGCDCNPECEDVGLPLSELTGVDDDRAYFQVFGVYDTVYDLWLSWPETEQVASELGFPTAPTLHVEDTSDEATFETTYEARRKLTEHAHQVINEGGEGIVVRSKFPFHYGEFSQRLGKYVRENHVKTDEHWSHKIVVPNNV